MQEQLDAEGLSGERQSRFEDLTGTFWFLWWLAHVHGHLTAAWERHRSAWSAVLRREGGLSASLTEVSETVDDAQADLNRMHSDSSGNDLAQFSPLLKADYTNKVNKLKAEISGFTTLVDRLEGFNQAMRDTDYAMNQCKAESYTSASVGFNDVANRYADLEEGVRSTNWPDALEDSGDEAACVTGAMQSGCNRLSTVAQAVANDNETDPDAAKRSARDRFESCDLVASDSAVVAEFYA